MTTSADPQLIVCFAEVAFDGGAFDDSVHSFDLTGCPRMPWFGQPSLDVETSARGFRHVNPNRYRAIAVLMSGAAELVLPGAVKCMQSSGSAVWGFAARLHQAAEEVGHWAARALSWASTKSSLDAPSIATSRWSFALRRSDLGDVDMETASRISFELAFG
jgi:hypothetical protein